MSTLRDFLLNARLGPLMFGLRQGQTKELLGEPEARSLRMNGESSIWKYGGLQLAFLANELNFIGLYIWKGEPVPNVLGVEGYYPQPGTTLKEFEAFLTDTGIEYRRDPDLTFAEQTVIIVGMGARVIFDDQVNGIDSIQVDRQLLELWPQN